MIPSVKNARKTNYDDRDEYFTKDQICSYLSIGLSTVALFHNKIKPIKYGNTNYYKKSDIESIVK